MRLVTSTALLLTHFNILSFAQQIPGALFSFDLLGLSDNCLAAVNKTILTCPSWLPLHAGIGDASFEILSAQRLEQLCETNCSRDLSTSRKAIQAACTSSKDVMVPGGIVAYPATFLADRYLYAIQLSFGNNRSTGEYCDSIVPSWSDQSSTENQTMAQNCSDCELGIQKLQLSSPFGYDDDGAETFSSLTSSCNAGGYTYATPATYAINATAVPTPPPRSCNSTYTVQEEDTCVSISVSQNVSTYGIISANGFDISCNLLPPPGSTICLPKTCDTIQLGIFDRCDDITSKLNITRQQLLSWNPNINQFCSNLYTCSPEGNVSPGQGNTVATSAPVPENAQPKSNTRCGKWYPAKKDDECGTISLAFSISLDDFYFLNPQVDMECSNLWQNTSYCVRPVGNVATYSGYPTRAPGTVFPKPTPTPASAAPPIVLPPLSAKADTIEGCEKYMNAFSKSIYKFFGDVEINACDIWAIQAGVTVEDLVAWNPSLSAENCVLQSDKSYCILKCKLKFYHCKSRSTYMLLTLYYLNSRYYHLIFPQCSKPNRYMFDADKPYITN
ncbi:carbohydrate-binding module family 50 protein [Aaosphaeria arxii CBS 175.79]|uniref:Carbohydrate-binding module family 50 protein n=1 Tax=Aaosphaeria arxii CBS 175.79 TaxID=1450172 RepID=A0A6A5X7W0_9PLEO|nr:carbohydrate-binding module family 50 protein [Aaosphaeria arxii CBS 175.79]KAF2009038.1 carbohydrate-binding module family 50 protein [Aaosphaeria arxii CBS 175.79]